MRIWIDQGGAYGNLGDEAMLTMAIGRLRRSIPGCEIVIAADEGQPLPDVGAYSRVNPPTIMLNEMAGGIRRRRWLTSITTPLLGDMADIRLARSLADCPKALPSGVRKTRQALLEAIESCDAFYAVGAANLHDWSLRHHVIPRRWTVEQFARRGKPTFIVGQTVGPLHNPLARADIRRMAQRATAFTLRDPEVSARWMRQAGVDESRYIVTGDEAFGLPAAPEQQVDAYLTEHGIQPGEPFVLAHIRQTNYRGKIIAGNPALLATLRELAKGCRVLLCPMSYGRHSGDDTAFGCRVAHESRLGDRLIIGRSIRDATLTRGIVERCDAVCALSYHLQVFAIAAAKPLICLASGDYYRHKAEALLAWLDADLRMLIDLDSTENPAEICRRTKEMADHFRGRLMVIGEAISARQDAFYNDLAARLNTLRPAGRRAA